ncbi:MAG: FAD-dependent oxidoreductase [bacterium]|nr:FAD-dependent oxidoreductase [bacterium]
MLETHKVRLLEKRNVARDTIAFVMEKPANFKYAAGQYVSMIVPSLIKEGPAECMRSMSFATAPNEDVLIIAMRLGPSLFKQTLKDLPLGEEIELRGPIGHFVCHDGDEPAVFIAGGIGIAPFRGLILENQFHNWPRKITLFYSSKKIDDASFLTELKNIKHDNFQFIPIITREKNWSGEKEHLSEAMLKKYITDIKKPIYYIVGLPEMVMEVNYMLNNCGIDQENIRTELFTGY